MISFGAVIRAGVTHIVFVHYSYAHAWLIRSKKLNRHSRERLTPLGTKAVGFDAEQPADDDFETVNVDESVILSNPETINLNPGMLESEEGAEKVDEEAEEKGENRDDNEEGAQINLEGVDLVKSRTRRGASRVRKTGEESVQILDAL